MAKNEITATSNPLIKRIRALRQKKGRAESGKFIVEGIAHVSEAVEAGWEVEVILHAPGLLSSQYAQDLLIRAERLDIDLQPVSPSVIESLADKENPSGILAVVRKKEYLLADVEGLSRAVALVSPQDPGNLGAILRTLDAVKADALFILDGGVDLFHPTVVRASMGALIWKPVVQANFDQFTEWARNKKIQLIATSAKGEVEYQALIPTTPWVLVLGSEQKGLSAEQSAACEVTVSMPMRGRVSSLNLAVAAGILLYQYK